MKRRDFLHKSLAAGGIAAGTCVSELYFPQYAHSFGTGGGIDVEEGLHYLDKGKEKNIMPEIRTEILNNPRAVFLIETHVDVPRDGRGFFSEARPELERIGKMVCGDIFIKGTRKGGSTLVKPNFTTVPDTVLSPVVGINTSPDFVAGFVNCLRELGNMNVILSDRGTDVVNHRKTGIYDVLDRHDIKLVEANYGEFSHYRKKDLNWHRVPNPVVWKNIPTYRPIGDKDNISINLAKLKNHNLGLTTLTIKNIQGMVPSGYGEYCFSWADVPIQAKYNDFIDFGRDFVPDFQERVEASFLKHSSMGYKYWDYEGLYPLYEKRGGWETFKKIRNEPKNVREFMQGIELLMWDEQWCQRAIDSAFAINPTINIIEGVIGRDGSGFDTGTDQLCNIIIVGQSKLEVDSVGSYIMGHDPGELFYTRIAKERGLGENDLEKISIYWIRNGNIIPLKNLSEIKRYKLGVNMHLWKESGKRLFW
jgi:uncharacterized protein (DUF362 family)